SSEVTVIDSFGNATQVAVGLEPVAVAVDVNTDKIYVANQASGNISVIDGATNLVADSMPAGRSPVALAVDQDRGILYVVNRGDNSVLTIDRKRNSVTIPAGQEPEGNAGRQRIRKPPVTHPSNKGLTIIHQHRA